MKLRQIAALVALVVGPALCARAVDAPSGCITFSASEPFGIRLKTDAKDPSKLPTVSLSWSANGQEWSTVADNADYAAALDGGTYKIHFRGTGNSALSDLSAYRSFTNTVDSVATKIACSGNIETLLDYQTVLNGGHPEMGEYAFARLFMGFEALTTAPELPATELNDMCYWFMFVNCTSLTNAPALPATKAAYWGYNGMFAGCTALTQAPELPATQLSVCCYTYMFSGCTALKKAPKLIATELKYGCYDDMFAGCTALTQAPELPATKLVEDCYRGMFYGCTALTALPEIPATSLERGCCDEMFYGCTALEVNKNGPGKEWKIPATSTSALEWGPGMFDGTSGDVQGQPALNTTYYIKSAPKDMDCVTFSASEPFGIRIRTSGKVPTAKIEYSADGWNWAKAADDTDYAAGPDGDTYEIRFRGTGNAALSSGQWRSFTNTVDSVATKIACAGNIETLLDYETVARGEHPTMGNKAFSGLFNGFDALTTAPELPATELTTQCYFAMFTGCSALVTAPELPALELTTWCYVYMFQDCSALATPPKLPATTLADACYYGMFFGCTSLITVPELPATTLAGECYCGMFAGCTSLVVNAAAPGKAWKIPATTGADDWGTDMFSGTKGTLQGQPELNTTYYIASAPKDMDCVTFSASEPFGIRIRTSGKVPTAKIEYSADGWNWAKAADDTDYAAGSDGDTYEIRFRGTGNAVLTSALNWRSFTNTVDSVATKIACSGNIETLLDYETVARGEHPTMGNYAFTRLFMGFEALTTAPELPATELSFLCYWNMFLGCASLTNAPALPAMKLRYHEYERLFAGCTALKVAPELPAMELDEGCYLDMFRGCTSLETVGDLPAQELPMDCYYDMFGGCTSLKRSPRIMAAAMNGDCCCWGMFRDCTALTAVPALAVTNMGDYSCCEMFRGCTSLTNAPAIPADAKMASGSCRAMFKDCTALEVAPALSTNLAAYCYALMFENCTALTTPPKLPATQLAEYCYMFMFRGCTALRTVPALPATELAYRCYGRMFSGCTALEVNTSAPGKAWGLPDVVTAVEEWGVGMFDGTGGDVQGQPELDTTYYIASEYDREIALGGDLKARDYGKGDFMVVGAGELTKAQADVLREEGVTNLVVGTGVTGIGSAAFQGCWSLENVRLGTNCTAVGSQAFHKCYRLIDVASLATDPVTVGDGAFFRCNSLESLSFAGEPTFGEEAYTLQAGIHIEGGMPQIYPIPVITIAGYTQVLQGKVNLSDPEWTPITTEGERSLHKFFRIVLEK